MFNFGRVDQARMKSDVSPMSFLFYWFDRFRKSKSGSICFKGVSLPMAQIGYAVL
jgi:hypothetical protein